MSTGSALPLSHVMVDQVLSGLDYVGSDVGRDALCKALKVLGLRAVTVEGEGQVPRHQSIDHIAIPERWSSGEPRFSDLVPMAGSSATIPRLSCLWRDRGEQSAENLDVGEFLALAQCGAVHVEDCEDVLHHVPSQRRSGLGKVTGRLRYGTLAPECNTQSPEEGCSWGGELKSPNSRVSLPSAEPAGVRRHAFEMNVEVGVHWANVY